MDVRKRRVDPKRDEEAHLELHCMANYESDTPWARKTSYASYREKWFSTPQPSSFLAALKTSLDDKRTIADLWETEDGGVAAYVWVTFTEVEGYGIVVGDIRDMAVAHEFQRQGIATRMLDEVSSTARANGAAVLRSETGIENVASDALHKKCGFTTNRMEYEKVLDEKAVSAGYGRQ